jgi:undecaprenyl-diphosphatase
MRGLLPTVALGAINVAVGRWLRSHPTLGDRETDVVRCLQTRRSRTSDAVAKVSSTITDVPAAVLHGLLATAVLRRVTGRWAVAMLPGLALGLEAAMYVTAGALVDRPRPDVPKLDHDQPTSSFPSGHQGAAVALLVVYAGLARRTGSPALRRGVTALAWGFPVLLGWSRTYVGMHYPSDVVAGAINGLVIGTLTVDWHDRATRGNRGQTLADGGE